MMIYRNTLLSLDIFGIESSIYDIARFLRDRLPLIFFQISISLTFHRTSTKHLVTKLGAKSYAQIGI